MIFSQQTTNHDNGIPPVRSMPFRAFSALLLAIVLLAPLGCNDKDDDDDPLSTYDRQPMLENLANNVIVPGYRQLSDAVNSLDEQVTQFAANPTAAVFEQIQLELEIVYKAWQSANMYEFGPAALVALRTNLNTYPTDTAKIESNIADSQTNLDILGNAAAKGLPALDYLLFGTNGGAALDLFTTDVHATNRRAYLLAVMADIKTKVSTVLQQWHPSGGNFAGEFSANTGTDVGSSLGELVNAMNQHLERNLRDGKIGIPSGVRSLGIPLPEKVEALYMGISAELATENLMAFERLYLGNDWEGNEGAGLDDHLIGLNDAALDQQIKSQLTAALTAVRNLNDPLFQTIQSNPAGVDLAFDELQKLVVLFKVDLPSRLGVLITYQDNDGD